MSLYHKWSFWSFERCTALNYIAIDICHDHQFSSDSLLGSVFKRRLVKLNLKACKYATFILETAATLKLKRNWNLVVL